MRRGKDDWATLLDSLSRLFEAGVRVDWKGFDRGYAHRRVDLPTYPFHRTRYWAPDSLPASDAPEPSQFVEAAEPEGMRSSLLGKRIPVAVDQDVYESRLSIGHPGYLRDHRVFDQAVVPATAYVEMALAAARTRFPADGLAIEDLQVQQPIVLMDDGTATRVQLLLTAENEDLFGFRILSCEQTSPNDSVWRLHASGRIRGNQSLPAGVASAEDRRSGTQSVGPADFYRACLANGLEYGPMFQGLQRLECFEDEAFAEVALPASIVSQADETVLHPALLDACLQTVGGCAQGQMEPGKTYVPVGMGTIRVHTDKPISHVLVHTQITERRTGRQPQVQRGPATIAAGWDSVCGSRIAAVSPSHA